MGIGHARHVGRGDVIDCTLIFCSYEEVTTTRMGLALHFDAVWAPSRGFGLGVAGLGNLNSQSSFAVLTLTLHLGRVR